jgi:sugar/nucleoside kinase (ribokinase family)
MSGLPPLWRSAAAIHVAPVAQEIDARQIARLSPRILGCTPQGWMRAWDRDRYGLVRTTPLRLPPDIVSRINIMVISSEESVAARDTLDVVGRTGLAVVTRGDQGARLTDRGRRVEVAPFPSPSIDTTGAGDVFAAALIAERADGAPVVASARYASAAAALKIAGHGIAAVPKREAVLDYIDRTRGR